MNETTVLETIESDRLVMKPVTENDMTLFSEILTSKEMTRYLPGNAASRKILEKLGMQAERDVNPYGSDDVETYAVNIVRVTNQMSANEKIQAVKQAECDLAAAHLTLDIACFDALLHPNYVIVQPGGKIEGKAETLASLQSGGRLWEIARSDQMDVQVYRETAVVTGCWRGKGKNGGTAFDYSARFLSVWIDENGIWRNVASQSTEIR
ncbi:MAG: nuclear transport factor 2 family protein [Anaerolineales bacterium]|nr:nuclear transport factor 2 family protein [Anaerolineales bacterium]